MGVPGIRNAMLEERAGHIVAQQSQPNPESNAQVWTTARAMRNLAAEQDRSGEPIVRQRLAAMKAATDTTVWSIQRAAAQRTNRQAAGAEANVAKLARSNQVRAARDLGPSLLGPHGMLAGPDQPGGGGVTDMVLSVPASSIAGGTDEVQRNIIGERTRRAQGTISRPRSTLPRHR